MSRQGRLRFASAPRVRSYFPEALYINPEIITDGNGVASISIPLADSITTWRMAMLASTPRGALGSGASSLKVFQDFFVDLDLPVTLTQGDRVSIPVAVYNYSGARRRQPAIAAGRLVLAGGRRPGEDPGGGFRPRGRIAVHHRSQAHRQIQADAARAHERRGQPRGHRGPGNRSDPQRPRAEPGVQRAPGYRRAARPELPRGLHPGRQQDLRPALSRAR